MLGSGLFIPKAWVGLRRSKRFSFFLKLYVVLFVKFFKRVCYKIDVTDRICGSAL